MPKEEWPLIPDVERLTKFVHSELKSKMVEEQNPYDKLLEESFSNPIAKSVSFFVVKVVLTFPI